VGIETLQKQLSQLWQLHSGESASARFAMMNSRATEVLRAINEQNWGDLRSLCESAVDSARRLWRESEALVITAAKVDEISDGKALLYGCKRLLEASDLLLASEEEILCLLDTGTENYSFAYENDGLCWQQHLR
jgi:hypothetical protein